MYSAGENIQTYLLSSLTLERRVLEGSYPEGRVDGSLAALGNRRVWGNALLDCLTQCRSSEEDGSKQGRSAHVGR